MVAREEQDAQTLLSCDMQFAQLPAQTTAWGSCHDDQLCCPAACVCLDAAVCNARGMITHTSLLPFCQDLAPIVTKVYAGAAYLGYMNLLGCHSSKWHARCHS